MDEAKAHIPSQWASTVSSWKQEVSLLSSGSSLGAYNLQNQILQKVV